MKLSSRKIITSAATFEPRRFCRCFLMVTTAAVFASVSIAAQAAADDEAKKYSGSLQTRSALSGDWGGARTALAEEGVTFDLSLTQVGQGITSGGKQTGWEYGGRGDLVINMDTEKLDLWRGGSFMVEAEGNFGQNVNTRTGAMMEVDSNQSYPSADSDGVALPQVKFTQQVSNQVGIVIGKMGTGQDANEFAVGKGDTTFFNVALTFNPAAFLTIPYSTLAAGVTMAPTGDPGHALLKAFVLDANGKAGTTGFDTVFHGNTTYTGEGRVRTNFFGRTGHQLLGASYSTKDFTAIDQDLRIVLEDRSLQQKNRSWCLYYNFDQYVYEPNNGSGRGLGIFGRLGASDGNPNPVHYFYSLGVGGKGVIPGRSLDSFGIGYYGITVGNPTFTGLFATRSFLGNEHGLEAYYDIALTPWMKLTPDVQFIRPAQRQMVSGGGVKSVETATVLGLRLQLIL